MTGSTKIAVLSGKNPSVGSTITWPWINDPKNWAAIPVLDGWGWGDYWDCDDWITYHKSYKAVLGQAAANDMFIKQFKLQTSDMSPFNWCKYNSTFANYFSSQGIDVGNMISNLVVGTGNVATSVATTATNLGTAAENLSQGISNTTKVASYILPLALLGIAAIAYKRASAGKTIVEYKGQRILR